ncbi:MAG: acetyl-CoA carboxylase biotin carboxyl carrier protein subunit [Bacteroidetes bacterium]|nr:acetyl-CoA carboxylase biotin carboxyl carrier protein subunit [Bacteroidota bacterium]
MYKVSIENKIVDVEQNKQNGYEITANSKKIILDCIKTAGNHYHVLSDNKSYNVELIAIDKLTKEVVLKINGIKYELKLKDKYDLLLESLGMDTASNSKINELKAPMPGLVIDILVKDGDSIKKGDSLLVLEAMKMENILKSPADATIKSIEVKKGNAVEKNQVLVSFA